MIKFILNDETITTGMPPGTLLLDFIRYHKHLTGTKIGCREGDCGACTVLTGELQRESLRYRSATCCLMALGNAHGKHIVTIEGVNREVLNPIQQAVADEGATQCGFCTPGFVISFTGFCLDNKEPSYKNAVDAINGNICRCTGYKSLERAAEKVAALVKNRNGGKINFCTATGILPEYFNGIKDRLKLLIPKPTGIVIQKEVLPKYLGGGTDLYVQQHDTMAHNELSLLFDCNDLKRIHLEDDNCIVGPSATVTDIVESDIFRNNFPQLDKFIRLVSSTPIRNMATVGGNFVNASPIGDLTIFFLALNAQIALSDGVNTREVPLHKFYLGYKVLDRKPNEYVNKIWFKLPGQFARFNFEKVSKRTHLDIASVNSAIKITTEDRKISNVCISAGGVAAVPTLLAKTSEFLTGKSISEKTILNAIDIAQDEISPISDSRGSKKYKRLLLGQLIKAHFVTLFPSLRVEKLFEQIT